MTTTSSDDFLAKGEEYSEVRREAFESYSRAADTVRRRLKEFVEASREGKVQAMIDRLEREVAAAERFKELTVLELRHADENWREWKEEVGRRRDEERWDHEKERLTRQEKSTASVTWAAWGSVVAALGSVVVTAWQVFGPGRHP